MFILDNLLVGGIRFVLDQVATAVDGEMNDEGGLREQLLAAQMQFELGEIEEDELADLERDIMARLREIRQRREEGAAIGLPADSRVVGVDVRFTGDDESD